MGELEVREGTLAHSVLKTLALAGVTLLNLARGTIVGLISVGLEAFFDMLTPGLRDVFRPVVEQLRNTPGIPPALATTLDNAMTTEGEAGAIASTIAGGVGTVTQAAGAFGPLSQVISYQAARNLLPGRIQPPDMALGIRRGLMDEGKALDWIGDLGFEPWVLELYKELIRWIPDAGLVRALRFSGTITEQEALAFLQRMGMGPEEATKVLTLPGRFPDLGELRQLLFRGEIDPAAVQGWLTRAGLDPKIAGQLSQHLNTLPDLATVRILLHRERITEDEAKGYLTKSGYTAEDTDRLLDIFPFYPPVQDLITMAVREVFTPEIAEYYGLFADLPEQFLEQAKLAGLPSEVAKWYWGAHWRLPSAGQGFTMFQRGIITDTELSDLLRALDIMPFWRDRLVQLAYRTLTRVDVRRMFALGVLDEAGVYQEYLNFGYSPENAERMTEFTIKYVQDKEREGTAGDVTGAYRDGALTRDVAKGLLRDLGFADSWAELKLDREDIRRAKKYAEQHIKAVRTLYLGGQIDESGVRVELAPLTLPDGQVAELLRLWGLERDRRAKRPSVSKVRDLLLDGVIEPDDFRRELAGLGYATVYVNWLTEEAALERQRRAQKEAERARKEQERLEEAALATAKQRELAALDVEIAEARLAIAELQFAAAEAVTDAEVAEISTTIKGFNVLIRERQLEKAEVRRRAVEEGE